MKRRGKETFAKGNEGEIHKNGGNEGEINKEGEEGQERE